MKFIDMTGKKFHNLTVIERTKWKTASASWVCRCDCGKETVVEGAKLRNGSTKSCGCRVKKEATDLRGQVFFRLTVINRVGSNKHKKALWECKCECGSDYVAVGTELISGHTKSCGCWKKEGQYNVTHGHKRVDKVSKVYRAWSNMKERCSNPKVKQYKDYGGRGITVCEQWMVFENFLADMGEPEGDLQIDRIDNDKGYYKENCRWTTRSINRRNSRGHVVKVTIDGEEMLVIDAVNKLKIVSARTVYSRINKGWDPKDAVSTPYTRSDNKGFR